MKKLLRKLKLLVKNFLGTVRWFNCRSVRFGLSVIALIVVFTWVFLGVAKAADTIDDILVYRGGGDSSIPEYKTRNSSGFSAEGTALDITSVIKYVKVNNQGILEDVDTKRDLEELSHLR